MNDESIIILLADDDAEDRLLTKDALDASHLSNRLDCVEDGEELIEYLHRSGKYEKLKDTKLPGLILLDLNMPRKDGREALKEIKEDPKLREIPVVVLTTSNEDEDIFKTYDMGANSFITKPVSFESLVETVRTLGKYWFEIVNMP